MKEILYIQAGALANYTGTHFWNTQESYFTYGEDDEALTFHDTSFGEGVNRKGEPTFCPRLLVLDRKANFGTLHSTDESAAVDGPPLWSGDVMEYRQDPIPKSQYQTGMDESDDDYDVGVKETRDTEIRYWSDFNRVSYNPRTMQQIPDPADWENVDGEWNLGQQSFIRYNEDTGLMEGPVRLFLEECDSPQGIQVMNDTASFGSFISSFLVSFHDEYLKLPSLIFPLLSDVVPRHIDVDDKRGARKVVNDAQYLRSLNELSSMSIPIQYPSTWPNNAWSSHLNVDLNNMYHTSAILSAHIESSTLPLRLRGTNDDLASFAAQLNWCGTTPFGNLSGIFPVTSSADLDGAQFEFSASRFDKDATQFARRDVSRGFSQPIVYAYERWSNRMSLQDAFVASVHAPAYPLPTSFPSFFKSPSMSPSRRTGVLMPARSTPMFSSITTSSQTADLFFEYSTFIENCVKRKSAVNVTVGLDMDEMKDLVNDLWTLHDNCGGGGDGARGIDDTCSLGEDEE